MSHTGVSSADMELSAPGARLCLPESPLPGCRTHGPTATGPDTHCGERLIPCHGCAGELSPRPSEGAGACRTPAPSRNSCCTPHCRGTCATVGHQGGKRKHHWVLLWGWARWQLSPTHGLCELPGWPTRAGCQVGDTQMASQEQWKGLSVACATLRQSSYVKHTRQL